MAEVNLRRILNQKDSFFAGDEFPEQRQKRSFPTSCAACDEDVLAGEHIIFQLVREPTFERPRFDEVVEIEVPVIKLTDCQGDAVQAARRDDGGNTAAIREPRIEDRLRLRDVVPQTAGDVLYGDHERFLPKRQPGDFLNKSILLDEYVTRTIHHDFADRVVQDEVLDRFQEREDHFESVCHWFWIPFVIGLRRQVAESRIYWGRCNRV